MVWQPIETAPKDDTKFCLGAFKRNGVLGRKKVVYTLVPTGFGIFERATAWKPLPKEWYEKNILLCIYAVMFIFTFGPFVASDNVPVIIKQDPRRNGLCHCWPVCFGSVAALLEL